jgi:hypothetical protein
VRKAGDVEVEIASRDALRLIGGERWVEVGGECWGVEVGILVVCSRMSRAAILGGCGLMWIGYSPSQGGVVGVGEGAGEGDSEGEGARTAEMAEERERAVGGGSAGTSKSMLR